MAKVRFDHVYKSYNERVQVIRPEGTRNVSSEVFIVGMGLKKSPADV